MTAYVAAAMELNKRCILDFFLDAEFFLTTPLPEATSNLTIISFKAACEAATSLLSTESMNFLTLVRTALLTALFRSRRSSLCRCRFSAEVRFTAKRKPPLHDTVYLNIHISGPTTYQIDQDLSINYKHLPIAGTVHAVAWIRWGALLEIRWTTLETLALFAFGYILDLAVFEKRFHLHFTTAGAGKFLRRNGGTGVLTGLGHDIFSLPEDSAAHGIGGPP
jgi:hypothetical protein